MAVPLALFRGACGFLDAAAQRRFSARRPRPCVSLLTPSRSDRSGREGSTALQNRPTSAAEGYPRPLSARGSCRPQSSNLRSAAWSAERTGGNGPAGTLGPSFLCADVHCAEESFLSCPGTFRHICVVTREAFQEQLGTAQGWGSARGQALRGPGTRRAPSGLRGAARTAHLPNTVTPAQHSSSFFSFEN